MDKMQISEKYSFCAFIGTVTLRATSPQISEEGLALYQHEGKANVNFHASK